MILYYWKLRLILKTRTFLHLCSWILKPPAYKTRLQCHAVNCKSFVNHRLVHCTCQWYKTSQAFTFSLWFHNWKRINCFTAEVNFFMKLPILQWSAFLTTQSRDCTTVVRNNTNYDRFDIEHEKWSLKK